MLLCSFNLNLCHKFSTLLKWYIVNLSANVEEKIEKSYVVLTKKYICTFTTCLYPSYLDSGAGLEIGTSNS